MSEAFGRTASLELPPLSPDVSSGYRAFELVWGDGSRVAMLGLRLKTGACLALGYAWLSRVEYDPAGSVSLTFPGVAVVELTGRNLRPVYEAVAAHQALWVAEADRPSGFLVAADEPVIESIRWTDPDSGGRDHAL